MTRRPDWQARLDSFLHAHAHDSFAYGSWDCCLFVCDAIQEMTGVDPASSFRNRYKTRSEAYSAIREQLGAKSLRAAVESITSTLGMQEAASMKLAQRGDVALIKRARDYSLGLIALNGREVIVCRSGGLCRISLNQAVRAWRV